MVVAVEVVLAVVVTNAVVVLFSLYIFFLKLYFHLAVSPEANDIRWMSPIIYTSYSHHLVIVWYIILATPGLSVPVTFVEYGLTKYLVCKDLLERGKGKWLVLHVILYKHMTNRQKYISTIPNLHNNCKPKSWPSYRSTHNDVVLTGSDYSIGDNTLLLQLLTWPSSSISA